jgi:hypothetical protein
MLQEIYAAGNIILRMTWEMSEHLEPQEAALVRKIIKSLEKANRQAFNEKNLDQLYSLSLQMFNLGENVRQLLG